MGCNMAVIDPLTTGRRFERRRAPRRKTLKDLQIVSVDRTWVIDCTLRNTSRSGALVAVPSTNDIPDRFCVRRRDQLRLIGCRVAWRTLTRIAFVFESDPGPLVPRDLAPDPALESGQFTTADQLKLPFSLTDAA